LLDTFPEWTASGLTTAAHATARTMDDFSLVGLAALVKDAVVLTAARESVVLYVEMVLGAALRPPRLKYLWNVDEDLAQQARRFIRMLNTLFGETLPPPDPKQAEHYWHACDSTEILGRCVRLGVDDRISPKRHYHWAICRDARGEFVVQEFWKPEVWTTARYRSALRGDGRCREF